MGKIHIEFDTQYEKGDVVIFKRGDALQVGLIEGYYIDNSAGDSIWYNIRVNPSTVYTYSNGGDVAEWDIEMKLEDEDGTLRRYITITGNEEE